MPKTRYQYLPCPGSPLQSTSLLTFLFALALTFTDLQGNVSELGRYLAEELSGVLAEEAHGFRVVDRSHLKVILQEHKLASTGLIDPQTARQLGRFTGVDTLVTGTITSAFGDSVRVSVKALDAETAEIIAQSHADVPKTKAVDELLQHGIGGAPANPEESSNPHRMSEINQPRQSGQQILRDPVKLVSEAT